MARTVDALTGKYAEGFLCVRIQHVITGAALRERMQFRLARHLDDAGGGTGMGAVAYAFHDGGSDTNRKARVMAALWMAQEAAAEQRAA